MDAVVSIAALYLTGTFRVNWNLSRDLTGPAGDDVGNRRHMRRERLDDDEALSVGRDIVDRRPLLPAAFAD